MKKISLIIVCLGMYMTGMAQNNFYPATGSVYFGVPPTGGVSEFDFQVHGINELCPPSLPNGGGPKLVCPIASRFGMTNTTTGLTATDGMLFTMAGINFRMMNQEKGNVRIGTNGLSLLFEATSKRMWVGTNAVFTDAKYARFNLLPTTDNGLFIKTRSNKYGLSIQSAQATDNAIQVMGTDGASRNFSVQANGFVFARKYTTTLANIPDYVFSTDYKLMSFTDLRSYVATNHHLPNVPSAKEYEKNGVDLGEMNRIQLEKIEELTLYILKLEEGLTKLEDKK